jgi:hypothetical protein
LIAARAQLQVSVSDEVSTELGATATTRMTLTIPANRETTVVETAAAVAYITGPSGLQILIDHLRPAAS